MTERADLLEEKAVLSPSTKESKKNRKLVVFNDAFFGAAAAGERKRAGGAELGVASGVERV